jgi:hypothetical protein
MRREAGGEHEGQLLATHLETWWRDARAVVAP